MKNDDKDVEKWMNDSLDLAISNMTKEMECNRKINQIIDFFKARKFNMYHPDVSPALRKQIFDLMDRWPRVSFVDHCMLTSFLTIREDPNISYEINPQGNGDEVPMGNVNLLDNIIDDKMKPVRFTVTKVNPIDNTVDLRDYNVIPKCIAKKRSAMIVHGNEHMTLTWEELTTKRVRRQPVTSIFTDTKYKNYELWSYKWIPDE